MEVGLPKIGVGAGSHRQICGRPDRRRLDAADRLWRYSRRGGDAANAQARPGHPHRDDRRRHPHAGGERGGDQSAQELPAGQVDRHLRAGVEQALPLHGPQPGAGDAPGELHQRPGAGRARTTTSSQSTRRCRSTCWASAARRAWAMRRTRARAGSRTLCVPPIVRAAARLSSCCPPPPRRHHLAHRALAVAGHACSTSKNDINYVVTEYGVAQLRGKSAKQRARELIGIAHPAFRAELTEQARRLKLL